MKYAFPAIFKKDAEDEKMINVTFVDILGAVTFGEGEEEALEMAKDLLTLYLQDQMNKDINPTPIEKIKVEDGKVLLVEVEL